MKKIPVLYIFLAVILSLYLYADSARAVSPSDFALKEGDVISAEGDPDVYIVNEFGFKRLFVNPDIFNLYGHLGWDKIKKVSSTTRDAFITSGLFRNCEANDERVFGLDVINEDIANLRWVNTTATQAIADDVDFFKKVFCINNSEVRLYGISSQYSSVLEISKYERRALTQNSISPTSAPKDFKEDALSKIRSVIAKYNIEIDEFQKNIDILNNITTTLKAIPTYSGTSLHEGKTILIKKNDELVISTLGIISSIDKQIIIWQKLYTDVYNANGIVEQKFVNDLDTLVIDYSNVTSIESIEISANNYIEKLNAKAFACRELQNPDYPLWLQERRAASLGCY